MRDPVCVFKPGKSTADEISKLSRLLENDGHLDRKVVVLSIAGRFRQGKSFLMNFIIRYLRAQGEPNWMEGGAHNEVLQGFDFRHAIDPVTQGILIWPEFFKIRDDSGNEIVVILMDTEGFFDTDKSTKNCNPVFSLSTLLSSIQIFNINQFIRREDLNHLDFSTQSGRLVAPRNFFENEHCDLPPFQELIFLVRDWVYPTEASFGWEGGQEVLKELLGRTDLEGERATMVTNIRSCFESLKCFLMPPPGKAADSSSDFRGKISDIDPRMVESMKSFIEDIFRPENLRIKRIHGVELTARDFISLVNRLVHRISNTSR